MRKSKLTKSDLIDFVHNDEYIKNMGFTRKSITDIVSVFIEKLRESIEKLQEGERIELRGFGTFGIKKRKGRIARNPKTGESVKVPERKTTYFKPGREIKLKVTKGK